MAWNFLLALCPFRVFLVYTSCCFICATAALCCVSWLLSFLQSRSVRVCPSLHDGSLLCLVLLTSRPSPRTATLSLLCSFVFFLVRLPTHYCQPSCLTLCSKCISCKELLVRCFVLKQRYRLSLGGAAASAHMYKTPHTFLFFVYHLGVFGCLHPFVVVG